MPRIKYPDYACPRCGYTTPAKSRMRLHLFSRSKPCPTIVEAIDLTPDIKQHILDNRIYHNPINHLQFTTYINAIGGEEDSDADTDT